GLLEDVINGEGSVDDQMSLLYNAVSNTGGTDEQQASLRRTLQNMMRGMGSDKESGRVNRIAEFAGDEFLKKGSRALYDQSFGRQGKKLRSFSGPRQFEKAELERGKRKEEKEREGQNKGNLFSRAVSAVRRRLGGRERSPQEEPVTAQGMLRSAGASTTTLRLLGAYRMLGAGKRDLLYFRLALIAWMVQGRQNSMYEIMRASHSAGLKGNEDLSEAALMYTTLDPLTERELRAYAPDNRFPHETIFLTMLNEVRSARRARPQGRSGAGGNMFQGLVPGGRTQEGAVDYDARNYNAQDMALNLYTSPAYKVMNAGARLEDEEEARALLRGGSKVYLGSSREEQGNEELMDKVYDVIQVASRLTQDTLAERGSEASDQAEILPVAEVMTPLGPVAYAQGGASFEGRAAYRGVTYRGGGVWPELKGAAGSTFTTNSLTSTSQLATIAAGFYDDGRGEKAMVRFRLDGKGSVRIADVSQIQGEAEVLVPVGTTFRIEHELADAYYRQGSVNQIWYPEEMDEAQLAQAQMHENLPLGYQGMWRKVRLVVVREISGPGEQRNLQQQGGRRKNQAKAQELSRYRAQMGARRTGMAGLFGAGR
ncbi:MAG: hypothetical protein LIO86_00540, partial [Lachnospiraceae bacterium]|nr:hypothetical protein [Lachnospiraceae bacterium]